MRPSKDNVAQRLISRLADARLQKVAIEKLFDAQFEATGLRYHDLFNFDNDSVHAAASRVALKLNPADERDQPILAAFKQADLNPADPHHWRWLLEAFSDVHFGKSSGAPEKWDTVEYIRLFFDVANLRKVNSKLKSTSAIARALHEQRDSKYAELSVETLRKAITRACDPKYNPILFHPEMRDPMLQALRASAEKRGEGWTAQLEQNLGELLPKIYEILDELNGVATKAKS